MRRAIAVLAVLVATAAPAAAESQRMTLECDDGRVIERTNGASWWGVDHAAGYVTEHLLITEDAQTRYEKHYGRHSGERSQCVADHVGSTWTVDLVRTR